MTYIIYCRNHFLLGEFNVASVQIDAGTEKMQAFDSCMIWNNRLLPVAYELMENQMFTAWKFLHI